MFARTRIGSLVSTGIVLAGALLTGCGGGKDPDAGTNKVGKLPPERIEARTRAAAESAKAVRMSGTVVSKGTTFRIDMRLKETGGVGEVTQGDSTFEVLRVGKDLYLKADEEFYRTRHGDADPSGGEAADKLEGKYVKVPTDDPSYKTLSAFTDLRVLLDGFFVLDGELEKGERDEVNGVRTITITADEGKGGSVAVSLENTPYPLRYKRAGGGGTLELTDYNKDFTLKAPDEKHIVDYGEEITDSE